MPPSAGITLPLFFEWELEGPFDALPSRVYSPSFGEACAPWRLLLYPRGNNLQQSQAADGTAHLSLYLDAPKAHTVPGRVIQSATFTMTLVHPTSAAKSLTRAASHSFSHDEWDWGYANLVELGRLKSEGFLHPGGKIKFVVEGTSVISPHEVVSMESCVPLPLNLGATMLAPLFLNTDNTWTDMLIAAAPAASRDEASTGKHSAAASHGNTSVRPTSEPAPRQPQQAGSSGVDAHAFEWQACHRVVLSSASPVFQAMLHSDMREGSSCRVVLQDTDTQVLRLCLSWVYGCEVLVPAHLLVPLWSLGHQYCIEALCDAVEGCVMGLLDSQPHLALQMYTITRHITPHDSRVNKVVCEVVQRHLPVCAASPGFKCLSWRHVTHAVAVAWDRFTDNSLEAAWQMPHDMLTVLNGVYEWLQHHKVLPSDTSPAARACAHTCPAVLASDTDASAAGAANLATSVTAANHRLLPAPPFLGAAAGDAQPAAVDVLGGPPPTAQYIQVGEPFSRQLNDDGVPAGAAIDDAGPPPASARLSRVQRLVALFEHQALIESAGAGLGRLRLGRCIRDLSQIVDMSGLSPRCAAGIQGHPLIELLQDLAASPSFPALANHIKASGRNRRHRCGQQPPAVPAAAAAAASPCSEVKGSGSAAGGIRSGAAAGAGGAVRTVTAGDGVFSAAACGAAGDAAAAGAGDHPNSQHWYLQPRWTADRCDVDECPRARMCDLLDPWSDEEPWESESEKDGSQPEEDKQAAEEQLCGCAAGSEQACAGVSSDTSDQAGSELVGGAGSAAGHEQSPEATSARCFPVPDTWEEVLGLCWPPTESQHTSLAQQVVDDLCSVSAAGPGPAPEVIAAAAAVVGGEGLGQEQPVEAVPPAAHLGQVPELTVLPGAISLLDGRLSTHNTSAIIAILPPSPTPLLPAALAPARPQLAGGELPSAAAPEPARLQPSGARQLSGLGSAAVHVHPNSLPRAAVPSGVLEPTAVCNRQLAGQSSRAYLTQQPAGTMRTPPRSRREQGGGRAAQHTGPWLAPGPALRSVALGRLSVEPGGAPAPAGARPLERGAVSRVPRLVHRA